MALPDGITTCTVTAGVPVTHTGAPVKAFVSIEPSVFLVHTATGTPLVDFLEELSINEGVVGQFTLPHTDQAGFQDENGNAYTNWYYTARISYSTVSKAKTKAPKIKVFQLATGQTLVDLDQLPGGAPALPYTAPIATVTSFGGRTGPVELLDADLPERLSSTSLSATYEPKGAAAAAVAPKLDKTEAASTYARHRGNTYVLAGDSRVDVESTGNNITTELDENYTRSGPFTWANAILGQRLEVLYNAGIAGNTAAQLLARYQTDVLAYSPGNVYLQIGVNSVTVGDSATTIKGQITQMLDLNRGIGARTVLATINPKDDHTTAQRAVLAELNRWIVSLVRPDVAVVDITTPTVSATEMKWRTGYFMNTDGAIPLHANQIAAAAQGKVLAETLGVLHPPRNVLPIMAADPTNIMPNPFMTGTGPGATGVSTYTPTAGTTLSLVPCTDGVPGNWQQFDSPGVSGHLTLNWNYTLSTVGLVAGDKVYAAMEFETEGLTAGAPGFVLYMKTGAAFTKTIHPFVKFPGDTAAYPYATAPTRLTLRTPAITIPAGITELHLQVDGDYTGKIRVRRTVIRKV